MPILGSRYTQEKYLGVSLGKCPFQQMSFAIGKFEDGWPNSEIEELN